MFLVLQQRGIHRHRRHRASRHSQYADGVVHQMFTEQLKDAAAQRDRTPLISQEDESRDVVDYNYVPERRKNSSEGRSRRPYSENIELDVPYRNGYNRLPCDASQRLWEEPYRLPRVQSRQEPMQQLRNGVAELRVSATPRSARPPPAPPTSTQTGKRPPAPEPRDTHTFEV